MKIFIANICGVSFKFSVMNGNPAAMSRNFHREKTVCIFHTIRPIHPSTVRFMQSVQQVTEVCNSW